MAILTGMSDNGGFAPGVLLQNMVFGKILEVKELIDIIFTLPYL